ncbi:probable pectinesterase/pectinesterase inhibitor 35 [Humulus lupulus]|uniref:probable pectinesterase/pectinesterase inhibitor 35 n=1 Tax=Humulus lupulus TaxID=3486 RepID=UPI002B40C45A|nr:probable pectinesterase/pectinesterase inhibitor 35 [Humulus lupulus]
MEIIIPCFSRKKLQNIFLLFILSSQILSSLNIAKAELKSSQSHFAKISRKPISSNFCKNTPFPSDCESIFLTDSSTSYPSSKQDLFDHSVQFTIGKAHWARVLAYNLSLTSSKRLGAHLETAAIIDCLDLLDDTVDLLSNVVVSRNEVPKSYRNDDVHTWLSAALTNQETCLESLETHRSESEKATMATTARNLSQLITNSLSLYLSSTNSKSGAGGRRLLSVGEFPAWVSAGDRKLLDTPVEEIEAHAVVAKDGTGTHGTIGAAIDELAASMAEGGRTVIQIKAGTYHEYIKIPTKQKNVLLVGEGKGKTVIVGNKNSDDGSTTYNSATVGAMGDGFIARDITFVNSAGPGKHQAVALRVGSDRSVVFRCSVQGYQDSLYTHSKRQFYRETDIYGTVDFIFGNSAVVFQSCNISPRKPSSSGLRNFITAQGRSSPDQNTGISIHNCRISAASDLAPSKSSYQTFLGRPWKQYSRTVIMESFLDDSISPSGWSPWSGEFGLKTLFYGEYMNSGPGASTGRRVGWAGYHASLTAPEANSFTVAGFISGNSWLPSTGVSFDSGLVG